MGCCISKCKPKKHYNLQPYSNHNNILEDKPIISQQSFKTPKISPITNPYSCYFNKIPPSSPSPTTTTNSSTSIISSCSSLSTGSSSILIPKDRSFSNEFLWSCVKDNPQVVRINSIKEYSHLVQPNVLPVRKLEAEAVSHIKQSIPQKKPQKRLRSSSPTPINRQKSSRRELERVVNPPYSSPQCRTLRSPSPSRRFSNGENCSKRMVNNLKVNAANNYNSFSSSYRKENCSMIKPVSPYNNLSHRRQVQSCSKKINRETCVHRIRSKSDEVALEEAVGHYDSEVTPMEEDIDNLLISLDCFIFV